MTADDTGGGIHPTTSKLVTISVTCGVINEIHYPLRNNGLTSDSNRNDSTNMEIRKGTRIKVYDCTNTWSLTLAMACVRSYL